MLDLSFFTMLIGGGAGRDRARNEAAARAAADLVALARVVPAEALARLDAVIDGLNPEQVEERLERFGPNVVAQEKPRHVLVREIYQAPDLQGRVSFPSKGGPLPPELRAYTKDRAMRYDLDEDLLADDGEDDSADGEEAAEESTADIEYYEEGESSSNE